MILALGDLQWVRVSADVFLGVSRKLYVSFDCVCVEKPIQHQNGFVLLFLPDFWLNSSRFMHFCRLSSQTLALTGFGKFLAMGGA